VRERLLPSLLAILLVGIVGCESLDSQLENADTLWFRPDGYEALFDHGNLHDIEIVISQEAWDAHIQDMKDYAAEDPMGYPMIGAYQKATFIYRGPAGDTVIGDVGFRTKGRSSRGLPQDDKGDLHRTHFKIRFNEVFDLVEGTNEYDLRNKRTFCTLRSLNLRANIMSRAGVGSEPGFSWDPTQISRVYCYDLTNRAGVYTSRTGFARLTITIDGQSHYFGVYHLIEPIDKSFLTRRYGRLRNDGNLYKCAVTPNSGPATLEPIPDHIPFFPEQRIIGVKDWEAHYRPTYDLKTNEEVEDHTALLDFIDNLNLLEGGALKEYLDENFEVDRFLRHQALSVLLGKWDDYWTVGNNYYLYFNNGGKIEFIPCDYDIVLGQGVNPFYTPSTGIYEWSNQFDTLAHFWIQASGGDEVIPDFGAPLIEKILGIVEYRDRYEQLFKEFITPSNELFVYSEYERAFNALYELLSPHVANDMGEGDVMVNDGTVASYFYERTLAVVDELGLDEEDYETEPDSLGSPVGLEATAEESDSTITVSWEAVPLADYYEVYRSDSRDGPYQRIGGNVSRTLFKDKEVAPASTYYYRVKAFTNGGADSEFSYEVVGYTGVMAPAADGDSTDSMALDAPHGVTATDGVYSDMILVTWDPVSNASLYRVHRADAAHGPYDQVGGDIRGTVFYDNTTEANRVCHYSVKAYGSDGGESESSTCVAGSTSSLGPRGPEIITGSALNEGTYSAANDLGTTTYVFNDDGTCAKSTPDPTGQIQGIMESEGNWRYVGNTVVIEMTMTVFNVVTVDMTEVWDNAFTIDDGLVLELMGLKQVRPDEANVVLQFEGTADIAAQVKGMGMDDKYEFPVRTEVSIRDDGSMEVTSAEVAYTGLGGDIRTKSETRPVDDRLKLIEFGGCYYLYALDETTLYTKQ